MLDWRGELGKLLPTDANKDRILLDKHLAEYAARNTFDYFIDPKGVRNLNGIDDPKIKFKRGN